MTHPTTGRHLEAVPPARALVNSTDTPITTTTIGSLTARARIIDALLDLKAAVPLATALLTVRRVPEGPDLAWFAYGDSDTLATPDTVTTMRSRYLDPSPSSMAGEEWGQAPWFVETTLRVKRSDNIKRGMTFVFMHEDRVVGSLHVSIAAELDDRGLHALEWARRTLENEVVSTVLAGDAGLDDRELDVLHGMAAGGTNQQIAASLQLSQSTVKATVGRILCKLDAANRLQAVRLAVRAGLI
ncbi:helix-turn-helix transcriptional regulator [Aeromicrobium erythreum]|uniref:helix-turn-helix transcriptional regulator n=1 Tax=Aeromicrobium erythreum TaxID=2041 RepID=UPI000AE85D9A|nr:helix-turn-helix transcriptional regulator [Aeromicrobium erythreum]